MDDNWVVIGVVAGVVLLFFVIMVTLKLREMISALTFENLSLHDQTFVVEEEPPDIRRLNPYRKY
jgi:hypothetical protein